MRIDLLTATHAKLESQHAAKAATRAPAAEPQKLIAAPAADEQSVTEVVAAAQHIEAYLERSGRALEFRVDAETNRTVVTVRDTASGEVIRQIPGDEVLHLARQLAAGAGGLVDLKV
jgi:flagellar protein FlaG